MGLVDSDDSPERGRLDPFPPWLIALSEYVIPGDWIIPTLHFSFSAGASWACGALTLALREGRVIGPREIPRKGGWLVNGRTLDENSLCVQAKEKERTSSSIAT